MHTTAIASPSLIERHRTEFTGSYTASKPNLIGRCRRFIETTDWEERLLGIEARLNGFCALLIASSVFYLVSVLVLRLLP
jgi:hypothetical protein